MNQAIRATDAAIARWLQGLRQRDLFEHITPALPNDCDFQR